MDENGLKEAKGASKNSSQSGDSNEDQRAKVGRDIKNRMNENITQMNTEGDPTRSDE
ncbi:MAG: hypothetical protein M3298_09935 [Thermoproteota archaeon]|nr:hypothetical protein [Thermoproteota archaeon]MDQ3808469.1 hypothetical protein [Thermoproteota archaeon]